MENRWLATAKRLQALASTGLHFTDDPFDRERYEEIKALADQMLADIGNVPINRIHDLVSDHAKGYATPKVDVRGAVIRDNKILLVQEKSDGCWALPGGYADVGLSASENIVKEVREEASLTVTATSLFGIKHKAKRAYEPDIRDFYKLFFLCDERAGAPPAPGTETSDAAFFDPDALPTLSQGRTVARDIAAAFEFRADPAQRAFFD